MFLRLTIEKLVYGGDGLARLDASVATGSTATDLDLRRKPVFVPFVLEGEVVEATLLGERSAFARARLDSIVQTSPRRAAPPCEHFTYCGGCQYQHSTYANQLTIKAAILRETLARTARLELACDLQIHGSEPQSLHYRNRARMQLRVPASGAKFALGYFRGGSNELLPVEHCPISSPLINRAMQAVWKLGRAGSVRGGGEIEFFASSSGTADAGEDALLIELHAKPGAPAWKKTSARAFAEALHHLLPELRGVALFPATEHEPTDQRNEHSTNARGLKPAASSVTKSVATKPGVRPSPKPRPYQESAAVESQAITVWGAGSLDYRVAGRTYLVPAGAFFQSNRHLLHELVTAVTSGIGHVAFDLYAGVGLFAVPLAECFERVTAVEIAPEAYAGLQRNVPPHVQTSRQTTAALLRDVRFRQALRHADLIVVDPPRAGLGDSVAQAIAETQAQRVVYVSCDPATMARDLLVFSAAGYTIQQAHLFDLFPQTAHLETVLHLTRPLRS